MNKNLPMICNFSMEISAKNLSKNRFFGSLGCICISLDNFEQYANQVQNPVLHLPPILPQCKSEKIFSWKYLITTIYLTTDLAECVATIFRVWRGCRSSFILQNTKSILEKKRTDSFRQFIWGVWHIKIFFRTRVFQCLCGVLCFLNTSGRASLEQRRPRQSN